MRPLIKLKKLIKEIALDNGMSQVKYPQWVKVCETFDLQKMEASLLHVTPEELVTLAAGEEREVAAIVEKYALQTVDKFLNEAFDGSLSSIFYF